jgi:osmotically-inducible protein OsmY
LKDFRNITMAHKQKGENVMLKLNRIITLLVCLVLSLSFMGCASTRTSESTGGYVDDSAVTTKVKSAILMDSSLKVMQINVETFKGEVQLSGFVDSQQSAAKAAEVARGVKGVKSVKNDLIVK